MSIFIIGATGLIGSTLSKLLIDSGYSVSGLARSNTAHDKLLSMGVTPIIGEVTDLEVLTAAISAVDVVVITAHLVMLEHQVVSNIIDIMQDSCKTLILCTGTGVVSEETQGRWSENTFSEYDQITHDNLMQFRRATENLVLSSSSRGLSRGIVVRPPAIWSDDQAVVTVTGICDSVKATQHACYVGEGLNMYSHIHVADLANIFKLSIEKGKDGALYHAVAGEIPNRFLAELVSKVMNVPTKSVSLPEAYDIWGETLTRVVFSSSSRTICPRTRKELGWQPIHTDMLDNAEKYVSRYFTQ